MPCPLRTTSSAHLNLKSAISGRWAWRTSMYVVACGADRRWLNEHEPYGLQTRKLSYRKDDRAMTLHMGAIKIFGNPWLRPRLISFLNFFNGLLFRSILWMCVQNLKFVALPIPQIIEITGLPKNWAVSGYSHAPFSSKFLMDFCSDGPCKCVGQLWTL